MDATVCPSCGIEVVPKQDGMCPECLQSVDVASPAPVESRIKHFGSAESRTVMLYAVVVGTMFAMGALYNIFANGLISGNAAADVLLSSACFWLFSFMKQEQHQIGEFHEWLVRNATALRSGKVPYRTVQLDMDSEVTHFQAAFSFLVVTFTVRSRPYVVGHDDILLNATKYGIYSLLFGWWGLPWGPVKTVAALAVNGSGGRRLRIRDLLADAQGDTRHVVRLTQSAGEEIRRVFSERRFAPGTAVRVVPLDPNVDEYAIEYDLPVNDGRDWQAESQELIVLIDKSDVEKWNLSEIRVGFEAGRFTFERP
jgi:hypothetical protein